MIGRALLLLAALAGPAAADPAVPEPDGYRTDDYRAPVPDTLQGATVLHVDGLRRLLEVSDPVLIDVLPAPRRPEGMRPGMPWMPQPHRTLPGSLWWPGVGTGVLPPGMEAAFRRRISEIVGDNRSRMLVFFCLSNCWMSWNAAKRAAGFGYRVAWFPDGADGWEAAGLPVQTAVPEWLE